MVIRKLLVLFLVLLIICVGPVSANTTGTLSVVSSDDTGLYNSLVFGADAGDANRAFSATSFNFRFTDAKRIDEFKIGSMLNNPGVLSATTPFTSTVDGIFYGSGVVSAYNDSTYLGVLDFDYSNINTSYADTLTGDKVIVTSYNSVWLFSEMSLRSQTDSFRSYTLTSSYPLSLYIPTSASQTVTDIYNVVDENPQYYVSYSSVSNIDYDYFYNSSSGFSDITIDKNNINSIVGLYDENNIPYYEDSSYNTVDKDFSFYRGVGVNFSMVTSVGFNSVWLDIEGVSDPTIFEYNIITELDEYSLGDFVNVTYTTDQKGTIQVVKTISGDIYHSIGFVSGATNATWKFYIAENEPYGFYDVHLLDSSNTILDTVRYVLLPSTSSLEILQSSVDLHETFVVFAQTVNESILSIEDPDGVKVWNETIDALMYDYIYYTPTIKTGIYTAYLYDDTTLNDTVMVYLADPPIIDDPLDPETNGSIVVEDVLEDDESMTEYFDEKFRGFAPTIWGLFMCMCVLFFMSILTSFNSGGKRR